MKTLLSLILAGLLLVGCAHPDGHVQARATQAAITRTSDDVLAADAANARAQIQVDGVSAQLDRIDRKTVLLLNSK